MQFRDDEHMSQHYTHSKVKQIHRPIFSQFRTYKDVSDVKQRENLNLIWTSYVKLPLLHNHNYFQESNLTAIALDLSINLLKYTNDTMTYYIIQTVFPYAIKYIAKFRNLLWSCLFFLTWKATDIVLLSRACSIITLVILKLTRICLLYSYKMKLNN